MTIIRAGFKMRTMVGSGYYNTLGFGMLTIFNIGISEYLKQMLLSRLFNNHTLYFCSMNCSIMSRRSDSEVFYDARCVRQPYPAACLCAVLVIVPSYTMFRFVLLCSHKVSCYLIHRSRTCKDLDLHFIRIM